MKTSLVIALLLMFVTLALGYIAWYLLWGKHHKEQNKESSPQISEQFISSMDRKAYCYPKINDVMGFDFISVVKVSEELTTGHAPKKENTRDDKAENQDRLTGANGRVSQDEDEPNLPDEVTPVDVSNSNSDEEPQTDYELVPTENISPYELEQLDKMAPWTNRDYDDGYSDEEIDTIISNNADLIDNTGSQDKEVLRIAKEQEIVRTINSMMDDMEKIDSSAEARGIIESLDKNGTLDPSDIPDI